MAGGSRRTGGGAAPAPPLAIELVGISKSFGPVQANRDIHLAVRRGTIHGIVGENGAGKSTLMSILYGFYQADAGEIRVERPADADPRQPGGDRAPASAWCTSTSCWSSPSPCSRTSCSAPRTGALLRPSLAKARAELKRLEEEYELEVDPDAVVGELSVGLQQRVEILKALYRECDILILDEPTGVLTPAEADHLFRILEHLKARGQDDHPHHPQAPRDHGGDRRGQRDAPRRDGADARRPPRPRPAELAELMVGRRVLLRVEKAPATPGPVVLEVDGLDLVDEQGRRAAEATSASTCAPARSSASPASPATASRSSSRCSPASARPPAGTVRLDGRAARPQPHRPTPTTGAAPASPTSPRTATAAAWSCPSPSGRTPASATRARSASRARPSPSTAPRSATSRARAIERFDIRPPSCDLKTANFSGGNQQKIVIAREMERDPEVLLVGQPTRGVDIGAIEFIHRQIVALRDRGKAILLVSVELDEIQALADRIIVMFDGRISGERLAGETDERELGLLMAGHRPGGAGGMRSTRIRVGARASLGHRIDLALRTRIALTRWQLSLKHLGIEA